jgi:hypothetical protein
MSQKITLFTDLPPAQSLAVEALASGWTITAAAKEAGVARETLSRWVHRDPQFIAALQNARAEAAAQTRCALESLGKRSVEVLREAIQSPYIAATRLKAACVVLKLLGADRAESLSPTTAEEVDLRFRVREEELRKCQTQLNASEVSTSQSIDIAEHPEVVLDVAGTAGVLAISAGGQ